MLCAINPIKSTRGLYNTFHSRANYLMPVICHVQVLERHGVPYKDDPIKPDRGIRQHDAQKRSAHNVYGQRQTGCSGRTKTINVNRGGSAFDASLTLAPFQR